MISFSSREEHSQGSNGSRDIKYGEGGGGGRDAHTPPHLRGAGRRGNVELLYSCTFAVFGFNVCTRRGGGGGGQMKMRLEFARNSRLTSLGYL